MNNEKLTYGQLYRKLRELGYAQRSASSNGQMGEIFEHNEFVGARIILPARCENDSVEPFYMNSVLSTLRSHEIVHETNPLLN